MKAPKPSYQAYLQSFILYAIIFMLLGTINSVLIEKKVISDASSLTNAFFNLWWLFILIWLGEAYRINKSRQNRPDPKR